MHARLFVCLIALSQIAFALDVYISPSGSDLNNCSVGSKCLTLQKARAALTSAGTIHVASGTYSGSGNTQITITAGYSITIQGASGSRPVFAGNGVQCWSTQAPIVIDSIELSGCVKTGIFLVCFLPFHLVSFRFGRRRRHQGPQ